MSLTIEITNDIKTVLKILGYKDEDLTTFLIREKLKEIKRENEPKEIIKILDIALQKKMVNFLDFLLKTNLISVNIGFAKSCYYGDIEISKLFLEDRSLLTMKDFELAFKNACYSGHLDMVKWLTVLEPKLSIHIYAACDDIFPFSIACMNHHLSVAEFLLEYTRRKENIIDIKKDYGYLFEWACNYNGLPMAKWLFKISHEGKNPIYTCSNHFKDGYWKALNRKNMSICEWMCTIPRE